MKYLRKNSNGDYQEVDIKLSDEDISIPDGADTLAGDIDTCYFWNHSDDGNKLIGCGDSLARYPSWVECKDSADEWLNECNDDTLKIMWVKE